MNRPKRRTYIKRYGWEHTERYIKALETYNHYLEKALDFERKAHIYDCKKWAEERAKDEQ